MIDILYFILESNIIYNYSIYVLEYLVPDKDINSSLKIIPILYKIEV